MKKILFLILTTSLLLFSGCGSIGKKNNSQPQEDITGTGLKISFDIDDTWVAQKKLSYRLEIENTGSEEIKLSRDNFKLITLDVNSQGGESAFTSDSINTFYNTIFPEGEIYLPQNAKITGVNGQLIISDWKFNNINLNEIKYTLEVSYPTKTKFSNNLEIQKDEKTPLKVTDKLSQAAPVQITSIKASPFENDEYYLEFTIQNKATTQENFKVLLRNIQIAFGGVSQSTCDGFTKKNNILQKITNNNLVLNKVTPELYYICKIDLSNYDNSKTTTSTSGSFEYDYSNILTGTINLPKKRSNTDIFE